MPHLRKVRGTEASGQLAPLQSEPDAWDATWRLMKRRRAASMSGVLGWCLEVGPGVGGDLCDFVSQVCGAGTSAGSPAIYNVGGM